MNRSVLMVLLVQLVMLIVSCRSNPPKPVLPDGSHRVPVNTVPVQAIPQDRGTP
ncbi:hypothetical protein LJR034_001476 [Caballeronia sp. LjRoot34]|uniref:hypothetical protein n=1 Tax=Caballeronia sp. LjRoot34 TaxID=3342325 RepID=UPI003ECE77C0